MLSKPAHGWSDFQLEGTSLYGLSYLGDIAFEWLDQAIQGLEALHPFCVKGYLEPDRLLCIVSYWNCHIIRECDENYPLSKNDVVNEVSHTSMLQFCQYLYDDISENIDEWASFDYRFDIGLYDDEEDLLKVEEEVAKKKDKLTQKLTQLKQLISEREKTFYKYHYF